MADSSGSPEEDMKNLDIPKDARIVALILKTMGVTEYEPRVLNQLLEFMHRYAVEVFQDAKEFSAHAEKSQLDLEDIRMATQARVNYSFTQPPPRELLLELAQKKNAIPLPVIPQKAGVLLPPDQFCLTAANYQVLPDGSLVGSKRPGEGAPASKQSKR